MRPLRKRSDAFSPATTDSLSRCGLGRPRWKIADNQAVLAIPDADSVTACPNARPSMMPVRSDATASSLKLIVDAWPSLPVLIDRGRAEFANDYM